MKPPTKLLIIALVLLALSTWHFVTAANKCAKKGGLWVKQGFDHVCIKGIVIE